MSQLGVVGGIPGPCGKLQGLALLVTSHIAPQNIDDVRGAWLVLSTGQLVEFAGEFLWYFDDSRNRFPWLVP